MPVIRPTGRGEPLATVRDHLADLLVKELMGERSRRGPVVFELPTERLDKVDVIVVWEAFRGLPPDGSERGRPGRVRSIRENPRIEHSLPRSGQAAYAARPGPGGRDRRDLGGRRFVNDLLPFEVRAQAAARGARS